MSKKSHHKNSEKTYVVECINPLYEVETLDVKASSKEAARDLVTQEIEKHVQLCRSGMKFLPDFEMIQPRVTSVMSKKDIKRTQTDALTKDLDRII